MFSESSSKRRSSPSSHRIRIEYHSSVTLVLFIATPVLAAPNRTKQHGWTDKQSAVNKHFESCNHWKEIVDMLCINGGEIDAMRLQINTVRDNTEIIRRSNNWLNLAFLESLSIKEEQPELNSGIRSCKDLNLF